MQIVGHYVPWPFDLLRLFGQPQWKPHSSQRWDTLSAWLQKCLLEKATQVPLLSLAGVKLCQKVLVPLFPWDSPLAEAGKNYVQWRPLTLERGFWLGRELLPCRRAPCTDGMKCEFYGKGLSTSHLWEHGDVHLSHHAKQNVFILPGACVATVSSDCESILGAVLCPGSVLRFQCHPGHNSKSTKGFNWTPVHGRRDEKSKDGFHLLMPHAPLQHGRCSYSSASLQTMAELSLDKHISRLKAACWVRTFLSRHSVRTQLTAAL